jgi:hypothetical protein
VRLSPGSLEHVALAFRLELLDRAVKELLTSEADKGGELFRDLLQCALAACYWCLHSFCHCRAHLGGPCRFAAEAGDQGHAWWALLGLAVVAWRQGKLKAAAGHLRVAQSLNVQMDRVHQLVRK